MSLEIISNAFAHYATGKRTEAKDLCGEILRDKNSPSHLLAMYLLGIIALDEGDLDNALNYLRIAVSSSPLFAAFYHNYGVALMRHGDTEKAIACFHQAVALDPGASAHAYSPTWRNLGDGTLLFEPGFSIDLAYAESAKILQLYLK
ncbi:putative TPR_REGION domain-containing protein [Gammaproteobacteria bacterium]